MGRSASEGDSPISAVRTSGQPPAQPAPSERSYQPGEVALDYPLEYLRRRVGSRGMIRLHGVRVGVSMALAGWDVGLRMDDRHRFGLWFCKLRLGEVDLQTEKFYAATQAD